MKPTIAELQASLIEAMQDPLAAVKTQKAADALEGLGLMVGSSGQVSLGDVSSITSVMLGGWTERDIELISHTPEFVIALTGMLRTALTHWVAENHKRMETRRAAQGKS